MGMLIDKVTITELKMIEHPKGDIFHALKQSDEGFSGFGEAYFTTIKKGEIKGWKKHITMQLNLIVPVGKIAIFVHDEACGITRKIILGQPDCYSRATIPAGLWTAFSGVADGLNMMLNLASIEHDPAEAMSVGIDSFSLDSSS